MKRIPLRNLADPANPMDVVDYPTVIRQVIRRPLSQAGADIEEMRRGIRVLDALDRCDSDTLVLEDSDWEHLAAKTKAMPWGVIDRRVIQFYDDIVGASDTITSSSNGLLDTSSVAAL